MKAITLALASLAVAALGVPWPEGMAQTPQATSRVTIEGLEPGPFRLVRGGEPRVEEFEVRLAFSGTLCAPGSIGVTVAAPIEGEDGDTVQTALDPSSLAFPVQGAYAEGAGGFNASQTVRLTITADERSPEKVEPAVVVTASTGGSGTTCTPAVPAAQGQATQTVFIVPPQDDDVEPGPPAPVDDPSSDGDDGGGIPVVPWPVLVVGLALVGLAFRPARR